MWMLIFLGCSTADAVSCQVYTKNDLLTYRSEMECHEEAMGVYFGMAMNGKFKYALPACVRVAGDEI